MHGTSLNLSHKSKVRSASSELQNFSELRRPFFFGFQVTCPTPASATVCFAPSRRCSPRPSNRSANPALLGPELPEHTSEHQNADGCLSITTKHRPSRIPFSKGPEFLNPPPYKSFNAFCFQSSPKRQRIPKGEAQHTRPDSQAHILVFVTSLNPQNPHS